MPRAMETVVETMDEVSGRVETDLARASEVEKESVTGMSRSEDNVPKEVPGVIDISGSPSFTDSMINEAQALKGKLGEGAQGAADPFNNFFDGLDSTASEGATGLGDLSVQVLSSDATGSSSSPKLVDRFPAPSVNPDRRRSITFSVPEDAQVFSTPVGIASYLRCLVTEEDQAVMNAVEAPCLFNEAQHALNRISSRLRCCIMRLSSESGKNMRLRFGNSPRRGILTSF
nr:uncharacterized protein LOC117276225 [Nicotiana tomentosiformis]